MGILTGSCAWCWDYHCDNCAPEGCRIKEAEYRSKQQAEIDEKNALEMAEKLKKIEEDNARRYAEYLARNGGVTDFERAVANFKGNDNETSKD